MRRQARLAFLAAPAVIGVVLTAALAACGSTAAPQAGASAAADPGAGTPGASTPAAHGPSGTAASARVPLVARQVQCPAAGIGLGHLPALPVQPDGPVQAAEPVPPGFKPVAVVRCITVTSATRGGFRLAERKEAAVTGLGRLLTALREPSTPKPKGPLPACMAPASTGTWFVLVSATGQIVRPLLPVGLCGEPIAPVLESLNSLRWITLSTVFGPGIIRPPLHGGPIHDITPAITAVQASAQ